MKSCEDCIHSDVCASYIISSEVFDHCNAERIANDCDSFVSAAAKRQLSVPLTVKHGKATDSSGNEIPVIQPCCPICGEAILNAQQRRIKFCPSCGQKLSTN